VQKEVERAQLEHEHQLVLAKLELQHQLDKQRIETELANFARDLDLAREVQRRLLPTTPPTLPDYKFASRYEPAEQVGGDYYDYIYLPGHRLAVVVADASGDGIPAALLMASFAGEMRQLLVSQPRPEVAVARLNDALVRSVPEGRFVTLIAVVIDLSTHMVTIINGGHQPPLLRHPGGQVITLKAKELNYPLGWFPQIEFVPLTVSLEPGDQLLLFTDGVDGAMNAQQASYGVARVQAVLGACPEGAAAVVQQLFADVKSFVGDRRQNDDMCIVSVARVVR
jgi:serine phosphatase RsbU (regulator of sigma subunit)